MHSSTLRFGLASILLLAALHSALYVWVSSFLRVEEVRIPYLAMSAGISAALLTGLRKFIRGGLFATCVLGLIGGYVSSVIALQCSRFFDRAGPTSVFAAVDAFGFVNVLWIDLVVAGILGSWLIGCVAALILRYWISNRKEVNGA